MAEDDAERWDRRHAGAGPGRPPEAFFVRHAAHLPRGGRALDLAGGTGRHARWLARAGLDTTLADVSAVALRTAEARAAAEGLRLHLVPCDVEEAVPAGPWDVVLVSWFLPRDPWDGVVAALAPGGTLWVLHPTRRNLERHAHPSARWLLEEGELAARVARSGLEPLVLEEGWDHAGRHLAAGVFRRNRGEGAVSERA